LKLFGNLLKYPDFIEIANFLIVVYRDEKKKIFLFRKFK
jgi:hypothetical protein